MRFRLVQALPQAHSANRPQVAVDAVCCHAAQTAECGIPADDLSKGAWHESPTRGTLFLWMPLWYWVSKGDWSYRQRFAAP